MIKKSQFVVLAFATLLSASVGATSIDSQLAQQGSGAQHGYMSNGVLDEPFGVDDQYSVPIFVRGGFNDWGTTDQMIFAEGVYQVVISIEAGFWEFKIASEDWSTVDLGIAGGATVFLDDPTFLEFSPGGGNLGLDFGVTGDYLFTLDTSLNPERSLDNPLLTVSFMGPLPIPVPGTLALIGLGLLLFAGSRKTR